MSLETQKSEPVIEMPGEAKQEPGLLSKLMGTIGLGGTPELPPAVEAPAEPEHGMLSTVSDKVTSVFEAVAPSWITGTPEDADRPRSEQPPKQTEEAKPASEGMAASIVSTAGNVVDAVETKAGEAVTSIKTAVEAVETKASDAVASIKATAGDMIGAAQEKFEAFEHAVESAAMSTPENAGEDSQTTKKKKKKKHHKKAAAKPEETETSKEAEEDNSYQPPPVAKKIAEVAREARMVGGRRIPAMRRTLSGENLPVARNAAGAPNEGERALEALGFDQSHGWFYDRSHQQGAANDSKRLPAQFFIPKDSNEKHIAQPFENPHIPQQRGTSHMQASHLRHAAHTEMDTSRK